MSTNNLAGSSAAPALRLAKPPSQSPGAAAGGRAAGNGRASNPSNHAL
jgi:hypothetical protein